MRSLLENISYLVAFLVLETGGLAIRLLPRRFCLLIARAFADLGFILVYRFRQRSIQNLRIALGGELHDGAVTVTARNSLRGFFRAFAEIGFALHSPLHGIREEIPVQGREHLEKALAKGKGVIVLSAHLGNFFLLGTRLAADGYPVQVLVKPTFGGSGRFADLMDRYRLRLGQRTIRARPRRMAARELIKALRQNQLVILIADEYRSRGIPVTFFGGTVLARRGVATLGMRTGAPVVPMCLVRESNGELVVVVEPELNFVQTGRLNEDVAENTRRITQWVEKVVRAYPDQWNWTVIRWQKSMPDSSHCDEEGSRRLA
ncbi:MAG: lysophospholipid acyltransferase family protein [Candidatus Binatia bacterium]